MTRKIAILATDKAIAGGMITLMETFDYCNMYWQNFNPEVNKPLFECVIVSPDGSPIQSGNSIFLPTIGIEETQEMKGVDAIIVASTLVRDEASVKSYLKKFAPLVPHLLEFAKTGKPVTAYCSGSLVLAATGLLKDKAATCAWWISPLFEKLYPDVKLTMNKIVVADKHIFTAGAASANLSLALVLIRQLAGEKLSNQISKLLLIDPNRSSQMPFMDTRLMPEHRDQLIHKVQHWMQKNLRENISLEQLADQFAVSSRTLIRRFKGATGVPPATYLQKLRVEEAKVLLETTDYTIENTANLVGYDDVSSFRKCFIKHTSLSPNSYRNRFKTDSVA